MRLLAAILALPLLHAQPAPAPAELLNSIRRNMRDNLEHLPDYTCSLTIDRSIRDQNDRRFSHIDTVRIEVGYVDGKELYAWPGEKFEDRKLDEMMPPGGAVGTGDFALHAKAIFISNAPAFTYAGLDDIDGRSVVHFRFQIPREKSRYAIGSAAALAVVAYHGSFWADVRTFQLQRLEIEADQIPPELKIARAANVLTYMVARIGGADFLLPKTSELLLRDSSGRENRNLTRFDRCRQYQGESVLSFADPAALTEPDRPVIQVDLPAGLLVQMSLRTDLQLDRLVIGDPISATVVRDAVKSGTVVIPKGAAVTGRITRVGSLRNGRSVDRMVGLRIDTIEFPGHRADFIGALETFAYAAARISVASFDQAPRRKNGARDPRLLEPGESILSIHGSVSRIPAGAHMFWRTLSKPK
jgi:hypothetical protein